MMQATACDCHVHVFDPKRFAYAQARRFTPGEATAVQLQAHLRQVGIQRVVLVQPSVYAAQNSCLLNALLTLGRRARGVAVVSEKTTEDEFSQLDSAGVCAARINLVVDHLESSSLALQKLREIEARMPPAWHVQLHVSAAVLGDLMSHIASSARHYVLDHLGLPDVSRGTQDPSWTRQLELVRSGKLYVKLSAPYLSSRSGPPYDDLTPFIHSLMNTRPDRLLWGSNWPHTQGTARHQATDGNVVEPFRIVDDRAWLDCCTRWAGPAAQALLADNAAKLYGFS